MKVLIAGKDGLKAVSLSRRKAIREKCLNCSGWVPKEVRNCEDQACPLFPYRSGKGKQDPDLRQDAIQTKCIRCMNDQPDEIRLCPTKDCSLYAFRLGRADRSVDIKSEAKMVHIATSSEVISGGEYLPIHYPR